MQTNTAELGYWDRVAMARTTITSPLDGEVFITAVWSGAGNPVCGATHEVAARRIAEGTHRQSTEEEIKHFRTEQANREQECRTMEAANNDRSALAELTKALAGRVPELKKERSN